MVHASLSMRAPMLVLACAVLAFDAPSTHAQSAYPSKPVRLIVPVAPGGGSDPLARMAAAKAGERLGQPFVVENITGASGLLAMQTVARAPADAYMLIINSSSSYNATMLSGKLEGDTRKLFAPVAQLTSQPLIMLVNVSLPIHNVQELVAYGKMNPDGLNFASPGIGTSSHLIGEIINQFTGLKMVHVPYKGIGPGILDVISGRIQMAFASPGASGPQVRAGKVRAVVATGAKRSSGLPDLPTLTEQGLKIDWVSWFGISTTYGSPRQNILTLNAAFNQAAATPEMQKMFAADGSDPAPGTPEQFGDTINGVLDAGAKVMKDMNIKLE